MAIYAIAAGLRPGKGRRRFITLPVQDKTINGVTFVATAKGHAVTDHRPDTLAKRSPRNEAPEVQSSE